MALFRSTNGKQNDDMSKLRQVAPGAPAQVNIIGRGTVVEGTLRSETDVSVSGRIDGNIEVAGRVFITPEGAVEGQINAGSAEIGGRVQGEITVKERLTLKSTAVVDGNVRTSKLVVEEGASFSGKCDMSGAIAAAQPAANSIRSPEADAA
ncbi:polymer-forming cytoskeletal protein [soil metagenome]